MTDRIDVRNPEGKRLPPGQIVTVKWPVLHYGTVPRVDLADLALPSLGRGGAAIRAHLGRAQSPAPSGNRVRHPLRDALEPLRQRVRRDSGTDPSSSGPGSSPRPVSSWCMRNRVYHQSSPLRPRSAGQSARIDPQWERSGSRTWRTGSAPHPAPVLVEERQMGDGGSSSSRKTTPDSGSRTAITSGASPGPRSDMGGPIRCGCGEAPDRDRALPFGAVRAIL